MKNAAPLIALLCAPLLPAQIRPGSPDAEAIQIKNGTLTAQGVTLKQLVQIAYKIPAAQIDGPTWISQDPFDVSATPISDLPKALTSAFTLKTKLTPRPTDCIVLALPPGGATPTLTQPTPPSQTRDGDIHLKGTGLTLATIASLLSGHSNRPVVDETGLTARYSLDISWDPDTESIADVVTNRLGLTAHSGVRAIDVLVVQHAQPLK